MLSFVWRSRAKCPEIVASLRSLDRNRLCPRLYSTQHEETAWSDSDVETEVGTQNGDQIEMKESEAGWNGIGRKSPEQEIVPMSEQRSLRVAIIGTPNSGKSTLANHFLHQKVLAVSPKVHTTARNAIGVFTEGNTQIVLSDTPGVINNRYARSVGMSREFTADPLRSVMDADVVLVMVDVAKRATREKLDVNILRLLRQHPHIPSILVLNKVDLVKKYILLKLVDRLTGSFATRTNEMEFMSRKLRNKKIVTAEKSKIRRELNCMREEVAAIKENRVREMEWMKAKSGFVGAKPEGKDGDAGTVHGDASNHPEGCGLEANTAELAPKEDHAHCLDADAGSALSLPYVSIDHWPYFDDIFMISALDGNGVQKLKQHLTSAAKLREWEYSVSAVTDQSALTLVQDIIRARIFLHTNKEIPYVVKQENVIWERNESGTLSIYQYLRCGKKSRVGILIGSKGQLIQKIKEEATQDLQELLQCPVDLTLHVKK